LPRRIEKFLIRRPFFRKLPHKLFSGNHPLLNQELRQCVSLREALDEQLFQRDRLFICFCHCASLLACYLDKVIVSQLQRLQPRRYRLKVGVLCC
jgi:hypothetical protein